jgi:hypothetical protein
MSAIADQISRSHATTGLFTLGWSCGLIVFMSAAPGCQRRAIVPTTQPTAPTTQASAPFIFIYRYPGFTLRPVSGLIAAVWQDGRIVRAKSKEDIGTLYVEGTLTGAEIENLRQLVRACLRDRPLQESLVIDAPSERLWFDTGWTLTQTCQTPGHEYSNNATIEMFKNYVFSMDLQKVVPPDQSWTQSPVSRDWLRQTDP